MNDKSCNVGNRFNFIVLPMVIFIIIPGFVLHENYADFSYLDDKFTLLTLVFLTIVSIAVLFLLERIFVFVKLGFCFRGLIEFITYLCICTGLLAPLSVASGMVDPSEIPVDWRNLLISLFVATVLYIGFNTKIKQYLAIGLYSFLGINLITALLAFQSAIYDVAPAKKTIHIASKVKNIFVVSFDGLPRDVGVELLQQDFRYKELFQDFVIYENAISSSPGTVASIFAETRGNGNFKEDYLTELDFDTGSPLMMLPNYLEANGYQVSTYGRYGERFNNNSRKFRELSLADQVGGGISDALDFFDYAWVRTASSILVLSPKYSNEIKRRLNKYFANVSRPAIAQLMEKHNGAKWDKHYISTKYDWDAYVDNLHISAEKPVAHFLHFLYTHYPVDFDEHCEYMSHDKDWHTANQNVSGTKKEMHCAYMQFAAFTKRLRALGIYDQSLIVFKSDHGKPAKYHDTDRLNSFRIRGHEKWGYGRYTPFLAIKGFDRQSDEIVFDDNLVMLDDLAKTLCEHAKTDLHCTQFKGYDLLQQDLEISDSSTSVIYIVQDANSSFRYGSHEALRLRREKDFLNNLNRALTNEMLVSSAPCHQTIQINHGVEWNNGFTNERSWVTWRDGASLFVKYLPASCGSGKLVLDISFESIVFELDIFVDDVKQKYSVNTGLDGVESKRIQLTFTTLQENIKLNTPVLIEARPVQRNHSGRAVLDAIRQE